MVRRSATIPGSACFETGPTDLIIDAFNNRTRHTFGPSFGVLGPTSGSPSANWVLQSTPVTLPLIFPGADDDSWGGGVHWNRVTPYFPLQGVTTVRVVIAAESVPDGGIGLWSPSTSWEWYLDPRLRPGTYELPTSVAADDYSIFSDSGNVYQPGMTGGGSVTYQTIGATTAGDSVDIGGGEMVLRVGPGDRSWVLALPYAPTMVWVRDEVTGRFRFRISPTTPGGTVGLTFAAGTLVVDPGAGTATLQTSGGSSTIPVGWDASVWYLADIGVDLAGGIVRAKVYPEDRPDPGWQMSAPTSGERTGTYEPEVSIAMHNDSPDTTWVVTISLIQAFAAASAPSALATPPLSAISPGSNAYGKAKSWATFPPDDGRTYAVGWSGDGLFTGPGGDPAWSAGMTWGIDLGDTGPGYLDGVLQSAKSIDLPSFVLLDPTRYSVAVSGEIHCYMNGNTLSDLFPGYVDIAVDVVAVVRVLGYGTGDPYYYEFSALGDDAAYVQFTGLVGSGGQPWKPFAFRSPVGNATGMFQWTVGMTGGRGDVEDALRANGVGIAFGLFPPGRSLFINVRDVKYELYDSALDLYLPFPCPPDATTGPVSLVEGSGSWPDSQ